MCWLCDCILGNKQVACAKQQQPQHQQIRNLVQLLLPRQVQKV
jgi:hypothetical protein